MGTQDSGKAANTSATRASTRGAQDDKQQTSAEAYREADGQKLAHEAQQEVAKRTPIEVPDIGKQAGDAGRAQLSDWEKQNSADFPEVTEESNREQLFQSAARTPAEKAAGEKK